ncbi:MAG: AAA family ATPase [Candidatus Methanomethylophilaceae archaeon]|nr:AAA family ATPase [Candidatus Methanomethylophilaceae archaeon]
MEFIGREKELSELEQTYSKGGSAVMVYGRRRIGKTSLLERFCEGKRNLFLRCLKDSDSSNLEYISASVSAFGGETAVLSSFMDMVKAMESIVASGKTVIVIDEFPYIASSLVSSLLQHFIDGPLKRSDSMLILCGSYISVMKKEYEDSGRPLFGRFRRIIHLGPLSFGETRGFHPNMSEYDALRLYLTIGGVPRYHAELDSPTFDQCIRENYIVNDWMTEEPEHLIESELPNPKRALSILSAIGNGSTSLKEIAQKVAVDETLCSKCIRLLIEMGIVSKIVPTFNAPKRPVYTISDGLFAFQYCVLQKNAGLLSPGHADELYRMLKPRIDMFLGKRFEQYCSGFIMDRFMTLEIGTWWMDRGDLHSKIGVTAKVSLDNIRYDLFCECKFRKEPMGFASLEALRMRSDRFLDRTNARFVLFSISGFDGRLSEYASNDPTVLLVGPEELFGHKEIPSL